ncbi:MAG: glycosyltransferase, partial [Candidatus Aminicenantes bacterium]
MKTKYTAQQRQEIIFQVKNQGRSVTSVCRQYEISRTLFYRWLKRYEQASQESSFQALKDRRSKRVRYSGQLRPQLEKQILAIIERQPQLSSQQLAKLIKERQLGSVSNHGVQNVLSRLDLNTRQKRERLASSRSKLTAYFRKQVIALVEKQGWTVARTCREYGLSRQAFYKWRRRYSAGESISLLNEIRPKPVRQSTQICEKVEKKIIKLVCAHPEYSSHMIAHIINNVGNHGVYNVLRRLDLNTLYKRRAYSVLHQPVQPVLPPVLVDLKGLLEKMPFVSSVPPPSFDNFKRLAKPFFLSLVTTLGLSSSALVFLNLLASQDTLWGKVGLMVAALSLGLGMVFFAYSAKYYLTLALVLSSSKQASNGNGNNHSDQEGSFNGSLGRKKGLLPFLASIFGIEIEVGRNGNGLPNNGLPTSLSASELNSSGLTSDLREGYRPGQGLQADLTNITLSRYPKVCVQLPLYNEKRVVERLLKACTQFDYPNYEVIVCDDSTDETTQIIERYITNWETKRATDPSLPLIKHLHRKDRTGFKGAALQNAMSHMAPDVEFITVFDADFVPYPDTLNQFVKYFKVVNGNTEEYTQSKIAVVGGYQWHVLNKSENWITRGVRTEYAGSYVIERAGRELMGLLKQISGSVYMARADVVQKIGWGSSITEDFQLTLKMYEQGYKVVYTPYIQAPAECVSTVKRLIRQRMRWAEGHSNNIRKMFIRLMWGRETEDQSFSNQSSSQVFNQAHQPAGSALGTQAISMTSSSPIYS